MSQDLENATFTFDHSEARGTVLVERGTYGVYISVNGVLMGIVDLFYLSECGQEVLEGEKTPLDKPYIRLAVFDRAGDEFAAARWPEGEEPEIQLDAFTRIVRFADNRPAEALNHFAGVIRIHPELIDPNDYIFGPGNV